MVAHVGAGGGARDGKGHAQPRALLVHRSCGRAKEATSQRVARVRGRRQLESGKLGREGERSGLALLPFQVLSVHQIQGRVDDVIRTLRLDVPAARDAAEAMHRQIVFGIEAREGLGLTVRGACRTEIAAGEPVAIEAVEREQIDVHTP